MTDQPKPNALLGILYLVVAGALAWFSYSMFTVASRPPEAVGLMTVDLLDFKYVRSRYDPHIEGTAQSAAKHTTFDRVSIAFSMEDKKGREIEVVTAHFGYVAPGQVLTIREPVRSQAVRARLKSISGN